MKSKISIGVDARFMLRPLRGIPLYVLRICENLPTLNSDYRFVYFVNKSFEHNDTSVNYQQRIDNIKNNNKNVTFINCDDDAEVKWEQIYLPRLLKKFDIDLLHMPGNRTCFFSRIPIIVTVHDVIEYEYINFNIFKKLIFSKNCEHPFYQLRMLIYAWLHYKFGFSMASHIVTVSEHSAGEINKFLKINRESITPIHHGLDDDFVLKQEVNFEIGGPDLASRKYVLMLGGDSPHKNPESAIASWAKVPVEIRRKFPLKIIGFSGGESSPLTKALFDYGLQGEVEVIGWISRDCLIQYFRSAALFLFLSRQEGFGFPPLQAMASGTPVIASKRASIPEILGSVGFQCDPANCEQISQGIIALLTDAALWKSQSVAGISRSKLFSWRLSARNHLDVYDRILRRHL